MQSIPKRLQHPRLPEMAFLEHEMLHFEDGDAFSVLPVGADNKSAENIDLLLGTQVQYLCNQNLIPVEQCANGCFGMRGVTACA